jgi:hypothetical protein
VPRGRLWFGAVAAAAAWLVHASASVWITWEACQGGSVRWGALSEAGVRWLLGALTLALLGVAGAALGVSYRNWRALAGSRRLARAEAPDREEFLALGGIFIGACFVAGILWGGLGPLWLDVCVTAK